MWSIYFENVIDIAEVLNAKKNLKIVDSAIFKTFFLSGCFFFKEQFFTFMLIGVFPNDADDFLSNTAKYNALLGVCQKTSKLANLSEILTVFGVETPIMGPTHAW